ncbi:hypothetical protein HGI30_19555 [Paenibacillus albicereus]|uniref:Uncharacterized protein n=1 Tax=Paenibacillus albicereus TaxID=2726185 RepID=A0A6H2H1I6_9BACL|nr:hypothetical protein [Paenibacillus albicereus]QJC53517.1 hypothetical protein HGI30_19555 [Paenibacillus albicereus]
MSSDSNGERRMELDVREALDQLGVEEGIREPLLKRLEEAVRNRSRRKGGERRDRPQA